MPRINSIEICGFRAFGKEIQRLELNSIVSVAWGPNSQGKTSLAEALEFLFVGTISRRALLASSQDEFSDSLRNAHLPDGIATYVDIELTSDDGSKHSIRRTLLADYGKREDCQSKLDVDGKPAAENALKQLGINLSQPPIPAPILMQHTLAYLFSAKPQERANYFKTVLEVTDLETLRNEISAVIETQKIPDSSSMQRLEICARNPSIASSLTCLTSNPPEVSKVDLALDNACSTLLRNSGLIAPDSSGARLSRLKEELSKRQNRMFPMDGFERKALGTWLPPNSSFWDALSNHATLTEAVAADERKALELFQAILSIPALENLSGPCDCPVCEAKDALTPERVAAIRARVQSNDKYQVSLKQTTDGLRHLEAMARTAKQTIQAALPKFVEWKHSGRAKYGFTLKRIRELLKERPTQIKAWLTALLFLIRRTTAARKAFADLLAITERYIQDPSLVKNMSELKSACDRANSEWSLLQRAIQEYAPAATDIAEPLKSAISQASQTQGWSDLIALSEDKSALCIALQEKAAHSQFRKDLDRALREIDAAKEKVLEKKFQDLSGDVQYWWDTLRPNENTFFAGVKPRAQAKRTIDFKAGLSIQGERSSSKLRDVIAVFSQSQLSCLGLAAFLARAKRDKHGFVILDDPILTSDDDHRAHFIHSAVAELTNTGIQVVLLTQDQDTRRDMASLYSHKDIDVFQITLDDPITGTTVVKTSDSISEMLARANPFIRNQTIEMRKRGAEILRDTAERLCKEILLKHRRSGGEPGAALSDYNGKTLGELTYLVEPLLTDAAHPGKLRALASTLNPGKHDDNAPTNGSLRVCHGDLSHFQKVYLR